MTQIVLGATMIALGGAFIIFATVTLYRQQPSGPADLSYEAILAMPSAIIYLMVGMLQLQLAWVLQVRSLKQDAIISILGALVAMGTLIAALCNMIAWINDDEVDLFLREDEQLVNTSETEDISNGYIHAPALLNATIRARVRQMDNYWRFWWLDAVFTIGTATILAAAGMWFLAENAMEGDRWWEPAFWLTPLPPKPDDPTGSGGDRLGLDEKTPLKKPP